MVSGSIATAELSLKMFMPLTKIQSLRWPTFWNQIRVRPRLAHCQSWQTEITSFRAVDFPCQNTRYTGIPGSGRWCTDRIACTQIIQGIAGCMTLIRLKVRSGTTSWIRVRTEIDGHWWHFSANRAIFQFSLRIKEYVGSAYAQWATLIAISGFIHCGVK